MTEPGTARRQWSVHAETYACPNGLHSQSWPGRTSKIRVGRGSPVRCVASGISVAVAVAIAIWLRIWVAALGRRRLRIGTRGGLGRVASWIGGGREVHVTPHAASRTTDRTSRGSCGRRFVVLRRGAGVVAGGSMTARLGLGARAQKGSGELTEASKSGT
jgi:hypothetical protein